MAGLGCGLGGFLGSLGRGEGVLLDRFHHGGGDGLGDRLLCDGSYGFVCCWLGRDDPVRWRRLLPQGP